MKFQKSLLALAATASIVVGQTTNTASFNQLTINGVGAGGTSCINVVTTAGTGLTVAYSALPASPIILATDMACAPGTLPLGPNNVVDITLTGALAFLLDGVTGSNGWLSQFMFTNATGNFSLTIPNAPALAGPLPLQGVVFGAGYAGGFNLTAAFTLFDNSFFPDPNLGASSPACSSGAVALVGVGDDTSTAVSLLPTAGPNWFNFYGISLGQVFVGSNGYLSQSSLTSFTESAANLTAGAGGAKIAAHYDDLLAAAGQMTAFVDNSVPGAEIAEFCWNAVPEFGGPANLNTFKITLTPTTITFDYGAMASTDGLVGLASGTPSTVATAYNMTLGSSNNVISPLGPTKAPFQLFTGTGASLNDLDNLQILFTLDASGNPISMN